MDARDRDRIVGRYNERLAQFGHDPRTLASGPSERHDLRFSILKQAGIESGMSVLDVGCGFGDFYGWLRQQGIDARYTGADINPALVEIAKANHPDAAFVVADLQVEDLRTRFDFVVSSSAFNLKLDATDNYAFAADMLARAYAIADRGVAFDFLSSYVDFTGDGAFHYQPERIFEIAKRLTKRVTLRHDYPLFEFCVYLYPDFEGWARAR
ncbi:MAG TPA: methyltransferase domain-containing protein [Vicinamibacterales bacterium]|nr:methyltransferase domain-containing protein [Vicinamibacterales bacterium]